MGKKKGCRTCAELGDVVLAELCEELGPECEEIEEQFRRGEIGPDELVTRLKDRFDPDQVAAMVDKIASKHR